MIDEDEDDNGCRLGAYYQVSDDVPAHVIQKFTEHCSNPNCQISARICDTTLAGVSSHYNKDGQKIIKDGNRKTIVLCCIECTKSEKVKD